MKTQKRVTCWEAKISELKTSATGTLSTARARPEPTLPFSCESLGKLPRGKAQE